MKKLILLISFLVAFAVPAFSYVRNIQDNTFISYNVIDSSGNHVTGQTVALSIRRASDGYWFDFSDSTFKASGWTSKTANLSENSTDGFYYYLFNPPASESGAEQYSFCIDNADATYGDHQCEVVDYLSLGGGSLTAQQVWEYNISAISTAGYAGTYLKAAGGAADPLLNAVPGSYTAGTAGYVIGQIKDFTDGDKESGSYSGIEELIRRHGN